MEKVNLPKVGKDTRARLNKFQADHNFKNLNNQLDTVSDTIDYLISTVEFFESVCLEGNLLDFTGEEIESMDIDPKYKEFLKKNSKKE